MFLLLVPFLIWRDPSTLRAETSNTKPTSFYFGQFMKPAHVINYIIPAMAPTRGRPFFNCFRAQVHACTRCLQSKVAPFQQPFMEANVKGGHGPLAGSDGPGCDAAAWHVSGPPDSKPVSCTSYIYCHCHDSGTLMSLNVSNFSSFTEFSAVA